MRRGVMVCVLLAAVAVGAEELTVSSILTAHKMGAPADGIIAMVNNPANTVKISSDELATLRSAGVPETVIAALQLRMPVPTPVPPATQPDTPGLVDLVKLVKSGLSETLIIEQLKASGKTYSPTINDLVYLKENAVPEPIIKELLSMRGPAPAAGAAAAGAGAAAATKAAPVVQPEEMVFDGLVLQKATFLKKNRPGRLTLKNDALSWVDGVDPRENFTFQLNGLEKVWLTCQARTPENFCYQANFQIVKGARYRFQDVSRDAGSNAAVLKLKDALRTYHPTLPYGPPEVEN